MVLDRTPAIGVDNERIASLDGLRGVALILVVAFHFDRLRLSSLPGGWLGVDVFFVLSGFVIARSLLAENDRGPISLTRFWGRRVRRLVPALTAMVIAVITYGWYFDETGLLDRIRPEVPATLLYYANWRDAFEPFDYFGGFLPAPLDHTWSLAIEEQFYVLFPILAILALKVGRRRQPKGERSAKGSEVVDSDNVAGRRLLLGVTVGLAVLSAVAMTAFFDEASIGRSYFGSDTRAGAILAGAALAVVMTLPVWKGVAVLPTTMWGGIGVVATAGAAIMWWTADGFDPWVYRGGIAAHEIAVVALIASLIQAPGAVLSRLFSIAPLRILGRISYGFYVWHLPVFVFLPDRGFGGAALGVVAVTLSLFLAATSFVLLEEPIRLGRAPWQVWNQTNQQRSQTIGLPGAAAESGLVTLRSFAVLSLIGVLGWLFAATDLQARAAAPDFITRAAASGDYGITAPGSTSTSFPVTDDAEGNTSLLVMGDSVAVSLDSGFRRASETHSTSIRVRAATFCDVFSGATQVRFDRRQAPAAGDCSDFFVAQAEHFKPRTVLVVLGLLVEERLVDGRWVSVCAADQAEEMTDQLRSLAERLSVDAEEVVFATRANYRPPGAHSSHPSDDAAACVNRFAAAAAQAEGARVIDLAGFVETLDDDSRPDGLHFWPDSAIVVANWLTDELQ